MRERSGPEAEETPQRRDIAPRIRAIERWLQRTEDELLYTPDAPGEAAATLCDARYYLCWGACGLGVLAILRFPVDARHPVAQKPYGAYAVGEVFPLTYQGQPYEGRVIERQVSRAEGLVELHVLATCGAGLRPRASEGRGDVKLSPLRRRRRGERTHAPTQSRQERAP